MRGLACSEVRAGQKDSQEGEPRNLVSEDAEGDLRPRELCSEAQWKEMPEGEEEPCAEHSYRRLWPGATREL